MAWTTPKDWADGDVVTESDLDTHVRDNLRYLKGLDGTVTLEDGLDLGSNELTVNSIEVIGSDGEVNAAAIEEHGASKHTNVSRELFVEAHVGTGSAELYRGSYRTVQLSDAATESCGWIFKVPDDFVSFTNVKIIWESTAASGNMYWRLSAQYAASSEAYTTHSDAPAIGATATGGFNILNVQESANALTLSSLASGDYVGIAMERQGGDASDTLNAAAHVFGLLFTYTANE